jgi:hypothetical protein
MSKKANILTENVIFIILNIIFFAMLLVFIYLNLSSTSLLAQKTSKKIALLIDASKSGAEIKLNIEDVLNAKSQEIDWPITVDNENNLVIVRLNEKTYYEYAFFNEVYVDYDVDFNTKLLHMMIE